MKVEKVREGNEVARWEKWESSEVTVEDSWLYSGGGEHRVAPRFHLFVSDVDQQTIGAGWDQDYLV